MNTTAIPTDIARILAERARQELERTAEKAADYRNKAHKCRKDAEISRIPEYAVASLNEAEHLDAKADRIDAEFKKLERICIALTKAGV